VLGGSLFGGSIADAVDRRLLLIVTQLSLAACSMGSPSTPSVAIRALALYGLSALSAGIASVDSPARSAVLATLVGREMSPAPARFGSCLFQVGQVAGPAIAGLLLGQVGIDSVYWIDAATFAVSLAAVVSLPSLRPPGGGTRFGLRSWPKDCRYLKAGRCCRGPLSSI